MLTAKAIIGKDNKQFESEGRRSLSPKVENKKKIMIKKCSLSNQLKKQSTIDIGSSLPLKNAKLSHQNQLNKNQNNQTIEESQNLQLQKQRQQESKQAHEKMEMQLKELEEQFMNRKMRKSQEESSSKCLPQNRQNQISMHFYTEHGNQSHQQNVFDQQNFTKSVPKQNKTLKLIKKSSKQKPKYQTSSYSDYPLSNNNPKNKILGHQQHSIVLQEEPWECDELELQQELKVLDEKIQGRKSMLNPKQSNMEHQIYQVFSKPATYKGFNSNDQKQTHQRFNSTQPLGNQDYPTDYQNTNRHKRSNTTLNMADRNHFYEDRLYNQNLFQRNQNLFAQNLDQNLDHTQIYQPKVVRLSLAALANQMTKKSRQSINGNPDRKNMIKNPSQHRMENFSKQEQLKKQVSLTNLRKETSCKSILLYEQAQKRGISPSKSTKSLKGNNKGVSPIKLYTCQDGQIQKIKRSMTPRGHSMKQAAQKFLQPRTNQTSIQKRGVRNVSPIQSKNIYKNLFAPSQIQNRTPKSQSSNSRTITNLMESQYLRANDEQYLMGRINNKFIQQTQQTKRGHDSSVILNQTYGHNNNSIFSNCQNYFAKQTENYYQNRTKGKWNKDTHLGQGVYVSKLNQKNGFSIKEHKKRKVLLSDQLQ